MIIKCNNVFGPVEIEFGRGEAGVVFCPPGLVGPGTEMMPKAPPCPTCGSAVFAFWTNEGPSFVEDEFLSVRPAQRINRLVPCMHEVDTCHFVKGREGGPQNVTDVVAWVMR